MQRRKKREGKPIQDPRVGGCHGGGPDEPRGERMKEEERRGEFLVASGW